MLTEALTSLGGLIVAAVYAQRRDRRRSPEKQLRYTSGLTVLTVWSIWIWLPMWFESSVFLVLGPVLTWQMALLLVSPGACYLAWRTGKTRWLTVESRRRARWVGVPLLVVASLLAMPAAVGLLLGGPDPARHAWAVEIDAPIGQRFSVQVPFMTAANPMAERSLGLMEDALHVSEGDVDGFRIDEEQGWMVIEGSGPVTLESDVRFYGTVAHKEAFHNYYLPGENVTLLAGDQILVTLRLRMDGGSCWFRTTLAARVGAGETVLLKTVGPYDERIGPTGPSSDRYMMYGTCS